MLVGKIAELMPDWYEWSKHPLVAVLVAGAIAALLVPWVAHYLQVRAKRMEFRFQVYREAAEAWADLSAAAWRLMAARGNLLIKSPIETMKELDEVKIRREREFDDRMLQAIRLSLIMPTLYRVTTQQAWARVIMQMEKFQYTHPLDEAKQLLDEASAIQSTFARQAAREIPVKYRVGVLVEPEEVKATQEQVSRAINMLLEKHKKAESAQNQARGGK